MSFFWYDYETWGKSPFRDRIVQFGGLRTDDELEPIGPNLNLLCRPTLDCAIGPGAVSVHGIMPMTAYNEGVSESEFATLIHDELSQSGTCSVAYNGMKFDHEFTRVLFYRNLRDPYQWHWKNGNSFWDTLELMRATFFLRPEAFPKWPRKENGNPSFQLGALARAFLDDSDLANQHDALADSIQMWQLAKLTRQNVREIWDYGLSLRDKHAVTTILQGHDPVLHIIGRIPTKRGCSTLLSPLDYHEGNTTYGFDLFEDPSPLMKPYQEWSQNDKKLAYRATFPINHAKSPFVCQWSVVRELVSSKISAQDLLDVMKLDETQIHKRHEMIQQLDSRDFNHPLCEYLQKKKGQSETFYTEKTPDADEAIYDGFFSDQDMDLMTKALNQGPEFDWRSVRSSDTRVEKLIFRYIARNFPDSLDDQGRERWHQYCRFRQLERKERRTVTPDQIFSFELRDRSKPWGNLNELHVQGLLKWQDRVREVLMSH